MLMTLAKHSTKQFKKHLPLHDLTALPGLCSISNLPTISVFPTLFDLPTLPGLHTLYALLSLLYEEKSHQYTFVSRTNHIFLIK